ncbi:MAG TPA: DUF1538 domain-containing protein [Thermoclostridium sp.]|nr:DUF1538 domain-containing protein [Thermoclostridium sp.]
MNLIREKTREVTRTLLPVFIIVLILCFTIVDVETDVMVRFIVGSVMLLAGLSIFLWGVDLSMNPIGEYMAQEVATSRSPIIIAILSFLLGFLITVAEPDLLVLGSQIESASGGTMSAQLIVYMVSIGVGVLIALGVFRLLKDVPLSIFMAITYGIIFIFALFVSEEFLAIAFDSSGATTGALTTPFILAISLGLSRVKGGKKSEENSFGLVGIMSAGAIIAVMLISVISGQKNIHGDVAEFLPAKGVFGPIFGIIPSVFFESLMALLPLTVLFFVFNFTKFKIKKGEMSVILKGLLYTLLGLTLFLTAVNSGFMDMGRIIGIQLASMSPWILIIIGFILGLIVVLVEPAVHVLGEQIEEVTAGHIPIKLIRMTLSLGVGIAIALSMVRIVVPEVKLWYFIIPGFALAILLSFKSEPIFVGIAYDAGGVASGPMTATFILAFAQGAASAIDTADVLVDGFGVIAMVAMAPVLSIIILGRVFEHKHKKVQSPVIEEETVVISPSLDDKDYDEQHNCIVVVVNRGFAEEVVSVARNAGARGATIMHGRGTEEKEEEKVLIPVVNIELQPEKEIIWLITGSRISVSVANRLLSHTKLIEEGEISVFVSSTESMGQE